jgi:hypothetical protein
VLPAPPMSITPTAFGPMEGAKTASGRTGDVSFVASIRLRRLAAGETTARASRVSERRRPALTPLMSCTPVGRASDHTGTPGAVWYPEGTGDFVHDDGIDTAIAIEVCLELELEWRFDGGGGKCAGTEQRGEGR